MAEPADDGLVIMNKEGVSLSTAIALLRSELREAAEEGENERFQFKVLSIELELDLAVKATRKANGNLSLWKVLTVGGGLEGEDSAKHHLKLVLAPHDATLPPGAETKIGDRQ
ncbi:trypco2 family protein [Amycolatopsis sp. NPDC058278]|uniref:trypco2 family protein n=1 Tax=Amycolatopsis sp. NPDC058278 TaxID=3346417 RepID=UPI0036D99291